MEQNRKETPEEVSAANAGAADRTGPHGAAHGDPADSRETVASSEFKETKLAPRRKSTNELTEWIKALAIAGVLVFVIRWFLVSPFIVDGESMQPNFWDRERIIVNKILYDIRQPERGEVIVFHVPDQGRDFIKRVVGLPGDTVRVEGDDVYINGAKLDEKYLAEAYENAHDQGTLYNRSENFPNSRYPDGVVPEGSVFVMGDNRSHSQDSREIGYIELDRIVGRADLVFWPLKDFHFIFH